MSTFKEVLAVIAILAVLFFVAARIIIIIPDGCFGGFADCPVEGE